EPIQHRGAYEDSGKEDAPEGAREGIALRASGHEKGNHVERRGEHVAHPNEELLRTGYDAFSKGDMDSIRGLFADDIVWHSPGRNPLAGDFRGVDEVLQTFGKVFELT